MRSNMKLWLMLVLIPWLMSAFLGLHYYIETSYFSLATLLIWGGFGIITLIALKQVLQRQAQADTNKLYETHYRNLVETAHDLVWTMDLRGCWTYLNKAANIIYGHDPRQMLGRPISQFVSPEHPDRESIPFADVLQGKELVQSEKVHIDKKGALHYLSFNAKPMLNSAGRIIGVHGTARDITERKAFESQLAYQAQHDALTTLPNRRYFQHELERVIARVARSGTTCALFYIDLDQFKYINDTLGHAAGDRLLIEFSALLKTHVREGDVLARFGGDEFTVLLYNVDEASALRAAENMRTLVESYRFLERGSVYNVSCSIGVAMIDNGVLTADDCMAQADVACHGAKRHGRNQAHLYNAGDHDKEGMQADMGWAARLRETLDRDRLQIVYQPIASLSNGKIQDYEVLVRMLCDDGQIILPGGFMPAAERFGLIHNVDRWMVSKSIEHLAQLHASGQFVRFSINLSGKAFEDQKLLPLIRSRLRETNLDPSLVTFEITETAAIANLSSAISFISALKDIGCQFALDDFGSGFSSFTYLKHLPVDKLKIDGSFVQSMINTPIDQVMVRSMNQVAHALGKVTIAEFVENEETLQMLKNYGVDYAQGYHVGRPAKWYSDISHIRPAAMTLQ